MGFSQIRKRYSQNTVLVSRLRILLLCTIGQGYNAENEAGVLRLE